jgi:hypothetical protein
VCSEIVLLSEPEIINPLIIATRDSIVQSRDEPWDIFLPPRRFRKLFKEGCNRAQHQLVFARFFYSPESVSKRPEMRASTQRIEDSARRASYFSAAKGELT